jgi:acetylornithine deacetylase
MMKELTLAGKLQDTELLYNEAVALLTQLISIPSFSREESKTADLLQFFLQNRGIAHTRIGNNICAKNLFFDPARPTILLNSHHDTVKPNSGYTRDPYDAKVIDGKLYGLGSNDAGASLVSLVATFLYFYEQPDLKYNLVFAGSAEEEISGSNGIELVLREFPFIECAIVGEPTLMQMAVAEKGLLVLDCVSHGKAGHAARNEGDNAIYHALKDIELIKNYSFPKVSETLGPVRMTVTSIVTDNKAHNVVPDNCRFTVDIRVTDAYTHEEIVDTLSGMLHCEIKPRGFRMRSSGIANGHPLVAAGNLIGLSSYGSPTTSDKALMNFPALKLGPGDSARSHTADEFVYLGEIRNGIEIYIELLKKVVNEN